MVEGLHNKKRFRLFDQRANGAADELPETKKRIF